MVSLSSLRLFILFCEILSLVFLALFSISSGKDDTLPKNQNPENNIDPNKENAPLMLLNSDNKDAKNYVSRLNLMLESTQEDKASLQPVPVTQNVNNIPKTPSIII